MTHYQNHNHNHNHSHASISRKQLSRREVVKLKAKENVQRSPFEASADWLTKNFGTVTFLWINILLFLVWIVVNLGVIRGIPVFDPFPFGLLTMAVSLEAIFLSIVVLISQNRAAKLAELREEIELQINIIAEQEITKIIEMLSKIMEYHKISTTNDPVLEQMLQPTNLEKIERELRKQLEG